MVMCLGPSQYAIIIIFQISNLYLNVLKLLSPVPRTFPVRVQFFGSLLETVTSQADENKPLNGVYILFVTELTLEFNVLR